MNAQTASLRTRVALGSAVVLIVAALALCIACLAPSHAYAAGSKSMWVVSSVETKTVQGGNTTVTTYGYKQGLITSQKRTIAWNGSKTTTQNTYKYDKKFRLSEVANKTDGTQLARKAVYTFNKKGLLIKIAYVPKMANASEMVKFAYDSKGRLKKMVEVYAEGNVTCKYAYNAKGNLKSFKRSSPKADSLSFQYQYDSKGFVKSYTQDDFGTSKHVNTYKGSRLVKQVKYDPFGNKVDVTTYKYKKVTVPKAAIGMVKAQQKTVFNTVLPLASAHR